MALTNEEIDKRISMLQDGLDSVSEVSFEGETTKYRSVAEIKKAIAYLTRLKESNGTTSTKKSRYRAVHHSIDRGF